MAPNRWLKVGSSLSRRFPNDTPRPGVIDLGSGAAGGGQISSCFPLARGRHNLPVLPRLFPKIHARVAPTPCHSRRLSAVTSLRARRTHRSQNPSRRANVLFSIAEGDTAPSPASLRRRSSCSDRAKRRTRIRSLFILP